MEKKACSTCGKLKATLECGLCHQALCKSCTQFVDEDTFAFYRKVPKDLTYQTYCEPCHTSTVVPALEIYQQKLETAKNIDVFLKNQSKETHGIKRTENPVRVVDCPDYSQALLKLAFYAAEANCNGLVDVDMQDKKVRDGKYQTTLWSGSGIPVIIEPGKLIRDRSFRHNPN